MNCNFCRAHLEDFLDERLDAAALEVFQFHVGHCSACRDLAYDAAWARLVTRSAFPLEAWNVSPTFFSKVWQAIEAKRASSFSWLAVPRLAVRFALGVAAVILVLVGADALSGPHLNENQVAIENYMEAPGAPDSFRDVLIGDLSTNRDQLLQNLLIRDRQPVSSPVSQGTPVPSPASNKAKK
jgi:hypothetical protein